MYIVGNLMSSSKRRLVDNYIRTGDCIVHNHKFYMVNMGEYYMEYMYIEDNYITMWLKSGRIIELDYCPLDVTFVYKG